ncbi:hypothetical protein J6590_062748 [Homalodisca vitripennis]|nr:hypothetical protein J6590_062748 [Homalodisca vitripennis]
MDLIDIDDVSEVVATGPMYGGISTVRALHRSIDRMPYIPPVAAALITHYTYYQIAADLTVRHYISTELELYRQYVPYIARSIVCPTYHSSPPPSLHITRITRSLPT